jgi:uncharacterized protein
MIKRVFALLTALTLLCLLACPALAAEEVAPYWYPESVTDFEDFHNDPSTPRLVDDADIFTDEEEAELTAKLDSLRENFPQSDFVVFTDNSSYGLDHDVYAADFYVFNGYGVGGDYNGVILLICMEPDNRCWYIWGTGGCEKLFQSDANIDHLNSTIAPYLRSGDYAQGVSAYLDDLNVLFSKGHFPKGIRPLVVIGALLGGLVIGFIVRTVLESEMNNVHEAVQADRYLDTGSVQLRHSADYFLYRTVNRVKREKSSSSHSSSSSSGRSGSGGGGSF